MLRRVLAPRRESQANSVEAPVTYKIPQRTAKPSPGKENMIEDISSPVNLQRQLHVSYDESTGNYRGLSEVLKATGAGSSRTSSSDIDRQAVPPRTPTPTKRNQRRKRLNRILSRRSPVIGSPLQVEHLVHVQVDPTSRYGFSGLPRKWEALLEKSGIQREEALDNPRDLIDVLNYSRGSFPRLLYEDEEEEPELGEPLELGPIEGVPPPSLLFLAEHKGGDFIVEDPYKAFQGMRKIGEGFAGSVFQATDPLGRDVAVKRIKVDNEEELEVVRSEVLMMGSINHECLVRCFGAYHWEDVAWISMEFVGGGSLANLLNDFRQDRRGSLDENYIAYIMANVMRGLEVVHERRFVHRDVKSDNTLLGLDGTVKLADFGLCAQLSENRLKRNSVVGTPCWMAPEVIGRESYDMKADVWSAGILAMECAEGRPPFPLEDPIRAMFLIKTKGPPQLQHPEAWSSDFVDFLEKSMAREPSERCSAAELLEHPFLDRACTRNEFVDLVGCALQERNFRHLDTSSHDLTCGDSIISDFQ